MADNLTTQSATLATVPANKDIATDDVASVHYQKIKIALGLDGAVDTLLDSGQQLSANSVPAVLASDHSDIKVTLDGESVTISGTVEVQSNSANIATEATALAIKTAVEIIDNAVDGSEMQVDIVDGGPVGAIDDAEATGDGSVIAVLKRLRTLLGGTITITGDVTNAGTFAVQVDGINGVADSNNSTVVPLGIGATFTGVSTDILQFAGINIAVHADVASATDGLAIQFSTDNTNWDHTDVFTVPAATGKTFSFQPVAQYFRVLYTNGGTGQSTFRLQTTMRTANTKPSSHRVADSISDQDDAEVVKAVLTGENPSNDFVNFQATASGNFKVSIEETNGGAILPVSQSGTWDINDVSGTISLPTGAATAAAQLADGHNVTIDNSTGAAAVNIQDGGNSLTVDNGGTFVVQEDGAALTALQLLDDTVVTLGTTTYSEATTKGNVIGAVRNDTLAALADTDNEIAPLQVDELGALYGNQGNRVSDDGVNSRAAATLAAAATFQGTSEDVRKYGRAGVAITSTNATDGTLYMEVSHDNSTWSSIPRAFANTSIAEPHMWNIVEPYFRIKYTNGTTEATALSIKVHYSNNANTLLGHQLDGTLLDETEAILTRSLLVGQEHDGNDYINIQSNQFGALEVEPEQHIIIDNANATTGWTVLGNDTTTLATDTNHVTGTLALSFAKADGAANTVFGGIQKTVTAIDLGDVSPHDIIQIPSYVSATADISYVFVRLGADSSNYNEWRIDGANLTGGDWQIFIFNVGDASFAGSTGNGWDSTAVTYVSLGYAFNAETDTLAGIVFDQISFHTNQHTSTSINSEVSSSINSANVNINKVGNKVVNTQAGNVGTGTQRITLATDDVNLAAINAGQLPDGHNVTIDNASIAVTNGGTFATQATLQTGANAIGKLAANSGVDIGDVDVTSQPARDNATDTITVSLDTSAIMNDTTALTPKFAVIDDAVSGDNTIVVAVTDKKIRVLSCFIVAAGAVNARFESGAAGTALTGQMNLTTNGGFVLPFNPVGWFETAASALLNLELSAAVSVDGSLTYVEV